MLLLMVLGLEVGLSTRRESPSWDEGDHIFSGYMNWRRGDYFLNPEHPPLVKLVATLPLLPLQLRVPALRGRYFKSEAYYDGHDLLFRNGRHEGGRYSADTLLFRIHMTVLVFAFVLALLLFVAGREMFGTAAGLIAMTLFVFDPTVLTNAPFVTTDMGAACGFFASVYTLYRFVRQMGWRRAVVCGVTLGLSLAAKHSALALVGIFALLLVGEAVGRWRAEGRWPGGAVRRMVLGYAAIVGTAWVVLWAMYSFRYAMRPVGVVLPAMAQQMRDLSPVARSLIGFCARVHLLPESYLYGLVDVQRVGSYMPTYFFGKLYAHGQWFYFPAILSLKWSVGVLGLLGLALYAFCTGRMGRPREVFFLALPALVYLGTAMASPLNIGVRHVLPVFPFAFALAGGGAGWLLGQRRAWAYPVGALLVWHAVASVRMFPNYMPYANVLWGGPSKTHLYFSDSATEWGQELKWVKQWTDAHGVKDCWFAYFPAPFLLPSDYGIPCKLLPTLDTMYEYGIDVPPVVHGPILVSFADLNGFEFGTEVRNPYRELFERRPDAVIADGVAVFEGDFRLPAAAALRFEESSREALAKHPAEAVRQARAAVALVPRGFDANVALGDALAATGDRAGARSAYEVARSRVDEMEPSSQPRWRRTLDRRMVKAGGQ